MKSSWVAAFFICNLCYQWRESLGLPLNYKIIAMITHQIFVENIKCSGCINSIKSVLLKIKGVSGVDIFKEEDKVCVSGIALEREQIIAKLAALGYPEKGNNSLISKAKSMVSCAVGKVS